MLCIFDDFANGDCAVRDIPQHAEFSWNGREKKSRQCDKEEIMTRRELYVRLYPDLQGASMFCRPSDWMKTCSRSMTGISKEHTMELCLLITIPLSLAHFHSDMLPDGPGLL